MGFLTHDQWQIWDQNTGIPQAFGKPPVGILENKEMDQILEKVDGLVVSGLCVGFYTLHIFL